MAMNELLTGLELGPIRPPSEAYSLLVRVSRNCPWNRCLFCSTYRGTRFGLRTVEEVKRDILAARAIADHISGLGRDDGGLRRAAAAMYEGALDDGARNVALWMYAGASSAFLQDANTLIVRTPELVEIVSFLRETLPSITRVTSYGRSHTAARKSLGELQALREAGLSRLHIGLESGSDGVLAYVDKGATSADHVAGGQKVVASGIALSEYVMPGLGGRRWRREHAVETARVLNEIGPHFVRVRTLTVKQGTALHEKMASGDFVPPSEDEMVEEIGWLIEGLRCSTELVSDHMMNLLQEIEGKLPEDRERMLGVVNAYFALPEADRLNFKVGRRTGYYERLSDLSNPWLREQVDRVAARLGREYASVDDAMAGLRAAQAR